jgi:hypothetical protein
MSEENMSDQTEQERDDVVARVLAHADNRSSGY